MSKKIKMIIGVYVQEGGDDDPKKFVRFVAIEIKYGYDMSQNQDNHFYAKISFRENIEKEMRIDSNLASTKNSFS